MRRRVAAAIAAGILGVVVVAFALAAFGDARDADARHGEQPGGSSGGGMAMCVEGVPDCDDMVVVPEPEVVEPNADAVGLHARPFDSATVGDDDRTIVIDFVSGVEPCYVLGRVDVEEGPRAVTVTLFEGHLDTGEDVACIDLGVFKRTTVTLAEPLDGRKVVDGAA
jgi:hypothetical protein